MLKHHPAANAFPMMDDKRYHELVADIQKHGQREPITLCDGMILDGRNRYKACLELAIAPTTKDFDGDPWAYVWSLNGQRRDLVQDQRYLIWKHCHEHSQAWQAEKARIQAEANRKRSEAAKERERTETGTFQPVCEQSVHAPVASKQPERKAKATASKTNPGAVARGDKLAKERPDLAEKVRLGKMNPALGESPIGPRNRRQPYRKEILKRGSGPPGKLSPQWMKRGRKSASNGGRETPWEEPRG
jgi:hypothetical protein